MASAESRAVKGCSPHRKKRRRLSRVAYEGDAKRPACRVKFGAYESKRTRWESSMLKNPVAILLGAIVPVVTTSLGCSSPSVKIRFLPDGVEMRSVTCDGERASLKAPGYYQASVKFDRDQPEKAIKISATSKEGVPVDQDEVVNRDSLRDVSVRVPAVVSVTLESNPSDDTVVTIDDEEIAPDGRVYRRELHLDQLEGNVHVRAEDRRNDVHDEVGRVIRAGSAVEIPLTLHVAARFKPDTKSVRYNHPVKFDASASTPRSCIRTYIWDFGDGTPKENTSDPTVAHTYVLDPSRGKKESFPVRLEVVAGRVTSEVFEDTLALDLSNDELAFDLEVFAEGRDLTPGKMVQFMLTPRNVPWPDQVKELTLDFGEAPTDGDGAVTATLSLDCKEGECSPILVDHTYAKPGRYTLNVTYRAPLAGHPDLEHARLCPASGSASTVVVSAPYLTDEQLVERAWEDFYRQLDALLHEAKVDRQPLVLTSLDSANFESEQPDFVPVVDRLTRYLVQDDEPYKVLERRSQVLARLAPEAVVDIRPELEGKVQSSALGAGPPAYLSSLDYGLATEHLGAERPIVYSLRLEGTDDRIRQAEKSGRNVAGDGNSANSGAFVQVEKVYDEASNLVLWLRNLPILVARFKTAEAVIALKVLQTPTPVTVGPVAYDTVLKQRMYRRSMSVTLHVRLLERDGRILRAGNVTGHAEQSLPESVASERAGLSTAGERTDHHPR